MRSIVVFASSFPGARLGHVEEVERAVIALRRDVAPRADDGSQRERGLRGEDRHRAHRGRDAVACDVAEDTGRREQLRRHVGRHIGWARDDDRRRLGATLATKSPMSIDRVAVASGSPTFSSPSAPCAACRVVRLPAPFIAARAGGIASRIPRSVDDEPARHACRPARSASRARRAARASPRRTSAAG
jgi:hypothetical protein